MSKGQYEPIIGLEVHIQLLTKSKAFSSDSTEFGAMPNTNVSPISLGHPGTLPRFNQQTLAFAVKLGIACGCSITEENRFARKNYFYADLPKGYQITQDNTPICRGGRIRIKTGNGQTKDIHLTRIHMEEDAGKSMHDRDPFDSLIDLNRAGVPLLEMVSEPEIQSSEEAYQFLTEVRKLVRYLDICDGNMEEGSLRCDANISIRKKGFKGFGTKVEVKNMNSIKNVQRAIEYEISRQTEILDKGEIIKSETRSFDAVKGTTFSLRTKEDAMDYRYFPEPDLSPVYADSSYIAGIREIMPPLPDELHDRFCNEYMLSEYDAGILTDSRDIAIYFDLLCSLTKNYKAAANWVNGPVKSYLNEQAIDILEFPLKPLKIAEIINLVDSGKVSFTMASQNIFPILINNTERSASGIAEENNWLQDDNTQTINQWIDQALQRFPEKIIEYKNGKKGLIGLFMGEVMKISAGKADPKLTNKLLAEALEKK